MIVDVWSDVVCPWCYIGSRRLQKALADFPNRGNVTIRHRAFELQPDISATVPTTEHLAHKYHIGLAQVEQMQANVCAIADGEGLYYELGETLSGNTFDAHRLLLWAEDIDKQAELLEAMYSGYFEKSLPLFSHTDLLAITDQVGIDHGSARALLESDKFHNQVLEDRELARQLGANGVPFFVFDMKFRISGAQPVESFIQTLDTAWKQLT